MSVKATIGCLVASSAIGAPIGSFTLALLLQAPDNTSLLTKIAIPVLGALATFVLGWIIYIPGALVLGWLGFWFLREVGIKHRRGYLLVGATLGLIGAMATDILAHDLVGSILSKSWSTNAYLVSWIVAGVVTMLVFWNIRRPNHPWDDEADRLQDINFFKK